MGPPRGKIASRQEKIKDILGDLGIAGETVSPSAARTIEELTHLGIIKGYSTIVAVGDEALVNKVITVIATEKTAKDVVLGIIPENFQSALARKIGANDLNSACSILKQRRLSTTNLVLLDPNKYFITEAIIKTFRNQEIYFSIGDLKGKVSANLITIKPGLEIFIHDQTLEGSKPSQFFRWLFGKKATDIYSSYLHPKKIRLEAEKSLNIKIADELVGKTPAIFSNRNRALKFIVGRGKIKSKD